MKAAGAKTQGQIHKKNKKPCQDHIIYRTGKNTLFAALADGAGSRKYGGESAKAAVEVTENYFKRKRKIYENHEKVASEISGLFETRLEKDGIEKKDAGTTLLFVAIRGNKYIAGHIGDGVIIMKDTGGIRVLSEPENGQFQNETFFLPQETQTDHFRIYTGNADKNYGFILASDGISGTLYDAKEKKPAYEACEKLIEWIRAASDREGREILENNLEKAFYNYSGDDKSIIVCAL